MYLAHYNHWPDWITALVVAASAASVVVPLAMNKKGPPMPKNVRTAPEVKVGDNSGDEARSNLFSRMERLKKATMLHQQGMREPLVSSNKLGAGV